MNLTVLLVLVIALVVLTVAVVLLYAMMGELAARMPEPIETVEPVDQIQDLPDYHLGATAPLWPPALQPLASARRSAVLVLSPVCKTCNSIAAELGRMRPGALGDPVGLVISTGQRETGEQFVSRHQLGDLPLVIDEGGAWVTGNFGVNMSPSLLAFDSGTLSAAYTFGSVEAVRTKINTVLSEGDVHAQVSK